MSNPTFETLSAEFLTTSTGGAVATTRDSTLGQTLQPILSSLRDLNTNAASSERQQQNQTMMMTMMAMMARR
jgi:hypothetical protein